MKKVILSAIAAVLTVVGLGSLATLSPAYAEGAGTALCPDGTPANGTYDNCYTNTTGVFSNTDLMGLLTVIINVIVGVVGFVAVVMIVIGGISFATSQGDTARVAKARNTVLYGVVGLVVALLAFAIVNFVLSAIFK